MVNRVQKIVLHPSIFYWRSLFFLFREAEYYLLRTMLTPGAFILCALYVRNNERVSLLEIIHCYELELPSEFEGKVISIVFAVLWKADDFWTNPGK